MGIARSREQNHRWNCPYQLMRIPDALAEKVGGRGLDTAADSEHYQYAVENGDLILLFTDGLTDNLHWYEIVRVVDEMVLAESGESKPRPEGVAHALVQAAYRRSLDEQAETPFSKNARRQRCACPGGKIDDVTDEVTLSCPHDPAASRFTPF